MESNKPTRSGVGSVILIAHRGNINGPNPERENHPEYILEALNQGYNVEVDLWWKKSLMDEWFLGHDEPQYRTHKKLLHRDGVWIHCKDYKTFQRLADTNLNFFYHTDEDYVLTGHNFIWAYPGKPGTENTICVMPEYYDTPVEGFAGVCSDFVEKYK